MGITTKNILDGDKSAFIEHTAFFTNLIKRFLKKLRCVILFFSNNHLCNYTKTIIRLRLGEYR
jgi:hypothetical protein